MSTLGKTLLKAQPNLSQKEAEDQADQLRAEAMTSVQEQRRAGKWDSLGPVECAKRIRTAHSMALEALITQTVEAQPVD